MWTTLKEYLSVFDVVTKQIVLLEPHQIFFCQNNFLKLTISFNIYDQKNYTIGIESYPQA